MSFTKMDPLFPGLNEEITNEKLAEIVAYSLQKDFGQYTSTIKTIGQAIQRDQENCQTRYR